MPDRAEQQASGEQIGNAVPPLLAADVAGALTGRAIDAEVTRAA